MLRIVVIRPGSTDFAEQGRITGTLDLPMNDRGVEQAHTAALSVSNLNVEVVYTCPSQAARRTAEMLSQNIGVKTKELSKFVNLDHGLWHGKLIEEVRQRQPKVYRQWQDNPECVCPPGGESLAAAQERVSVVIGKLLKRHTQGVIAIVVPEPMASLVISELQGGKPVGDLWKAECRCGSWDVIDVEPRKAATSH